MQELSDTELLRRYAEQNSEAAFAALVARHVNLVYSAALRKTGSDQAAGEITQVVFIILARKAPGLRAGTLLSGWLYQTVRLTAANFLRTEIRRARREQEACMQSLANEPEPELWPRIMPLLENAMGQLGEHERDAVVLRYFEGKSFQEIGALAGASENAVKKRVGRALEKLHRYFAQRGISSTTAILAGAISAHSVQVAPVALAKTATALAVAKGATASVSTSTLIKGALKIMAWTKIKTSVVVALGVLLAAGTTTIAVKEIQEHKTYPWQQWKFIDRAALDRLPPQLAVLPQKFAPGVGWGGSDKLLGLGVDCNIMMQAAYAHTYGTKHLTRILPLVQLPAGRFDFIASLPSGNPEALQQEIKRKFGLVARLETRETEVLLLTVKTPNAPGIRPVATNWNDAILHRGRFYSNGADMGTLCMYLEDYCQMPVLDRTALGGNFAMNVAWREPVHARNPEGLNQAMIDQLGLELVPSREPLKMLVIDRAKD